MARASGSKTRDYPVHTLEKALVIIKAIADKGAGKAMDRLLVAEAVGRRPGSSEYRRLLSSSLKFGLTTGTEKADYITPTDLGLKIVKPRSEEEKVRGIVEACLTPPLFERIYNNFNRNKLPDSDFLKNTLERMFDVDASLSEEVAKLVFENAKFSGILQEISGAHYILIEEPKIANMDQESEDIVEDNGQQKGEDLSLPKSEELSGIVKEGASHEPRKPRQLFVAHGKNREPLEDLKKILDEFKIPYKIAVDEPNKGRPISMKVAELMGECSAGVFIFTRDEQFFRKDEDGNTEEVWRPSENAVYELGAASILWEKKIIILKEEGVNFPSDFSDLGYITFKEGEIKHRALELLKELVGLELVKLEAA